MVPPVTSSPCKVKNVCAAPAAAPAAPSRRHPAARRRVLRRGAAAPGTSGGTAQAPTPGYSQPAWTQKRTGFGAGAAVRLSRTAPGAPRPARGTRSRRRPCAWRWPMLRPARRSPQASRRACCMQPPQPPAPSRQARRSAAPCALPSRLPAPAPSCRTPGQWPAAAHHAPAAARPAEGRRRRATPLRAPGPWPAAAPPHALCSPGAGRATPSQPGGTL